MKRGVLAPVAFAAVAALVSGCSSGSRVGPHLDGGPDADANATADSAPAGTGCTDTSVPPRTLECTGLYSNFWTKQLGAGVRAYAPAVALWSDGAEKRRWIALPPGTKIDASDPSEWKFPVGTKVWKEFRWAGRRVETRLFQKVLEDHWVHAAYAWNARETATSLSPGGDVPAPDGGTYHIPTRDECEDCHRGRSDRLLGFEEVSLGLPGATGLTLEALVAEGRIDPVPARTSLEIGDDGTGLSVGPLGWLHANCGTSCHNGNPAATANAAGMILRLDPTLLDGRSSAAFDPLTTTLGQQVNAPGWHGRTRIVSGAPEESLLVLLISNRGTNNEVGNQMPPLATRLVDTEHVRSVVEWIRRMPVTLPPLKDAGTPDASVGVPEGDTEVPVPDARAPEAGVRPDAAPAPADASTHPIKDSGADARVDARATTPLR